MRLGRRPFTSPQPLRQVGAEAADVGAKELSPRRTGRAEMARELLKGVTRRMYMPIAAFTAVAEMASLFSSESGPVVAPHPPSEVRATTPMFAPSSLSKSGGSGS